jgi:hypothetical protein
MDVAELVAREAIRDLVAAYVHAADRGRFEEVAALFGTDGVLELPDGRTAEGPAIVDFLRGTGAELAGATAKPWVRHHVTSHRILLVDPTHGEGHAYYFVVTERGPDHWGRYHDRYVSADGTWRFARRTVRLDGFSPDSWAAARRS